MDETTAIVRRIFLRAAQRIGSVAALSRELGTSYSEIKAYVAGEAVPPESVLLRAVEICIDDLRELRSGFSERAWQSLSLPDAGSRRP
jgi:hypothetical protein